MPRKERNELKKLAQMQEAAAGISNRPINTFFNTSRTESSGYTYSAGLLVEYTRGAIFNHSFGFMNSENIILHTDTNCRWFINFYDLLN